MVLAIGIVFAFPCYGQDYSDVPETSEYYEPVLRLSRLSVVGGYPDGSFGIDKNITRAEVAVLAVRMSGNSDNVTKLESSYDDVSNDYWAADFIMFCKENGIMNGVGDNKFNPEADITDEELITLLVRLSGTDTNNFLYPDSYIKEANLKDITREYDYEIGHIITRGEAAVLLRNTLDAPLTKDGVTYNGREETEYETIYTTIFGGVYPLGMKFASSAGVKNGTVNINYNSINLYELNGEKYIFAECLEEQGFDVSYDEGKNAVYVVRDKKEIPDCMIGFKTATGTYVNPWNDDKYSLTDKNTQVYLDGELVESHSTEGGNLISVEELNRYGTRTEGGFDILVSNMVKKSQSGMSTVYAFEDEPNNYVSAVVFADGWYVPSVTVYNYDEEQNKYYKCMYHDRSFGGGGREPYYEYTFTESGECDADKNLINGVYSTHNKVAIYWRRYLVRDGAAELIYDSLTDN